MTNDLRVMLLILAVFWGAWWLLAIIAKRSYLPIIPFYPLVLAVVGYVLNKVYPWAGTCVVTILHLPIALKITRDILRHPPHRNG